MKHLLLSSLFAILASSISAGAADAPAAVANCPLLRQAQATIIVYKATFTQQNGVWISTSQEVGRSQTLVPVVQSVRGGCNIGMSGLLRLDNVIVNGQPETLNIHAWVIVANDTNPTYINKRFAASYWLSSANGRNGWASADSDDLKQEKIGLNLNMETAATTSTAHDDVVTIQVKFDDNAQ